MGFWLKTSICQSDMVHEFCCMNFPTGVGNLKASTVCQRESARRVQFSGNHAAVDGVRCVAVPFIHCSSGGNRARSGGQAKKAPISSWDFVWNYHSLFKCAQDNSLQSPAQMLQTPSCSAVVWSQSHLPSHALINNLIVCNKSCCCCTYFKL